MKNDSPAWAVIRSRAWRPCSLPQGTELLSDRVKAICRCIVNSNWLWFHSLFSSLRYASSMCKHASWPQCTRTCWTLFICSGGADNDESRCLLPSYSQNHVIRGPVDLTICDKTSKKKIENILWVSVIGSDFWKTGWMEVWQSLDWRAQRIRWWQDCVSRSWNFVAVFLFLKCRCTGSCDTERSLPFCIRTMTHLSLKVHCGTTSVSKNKNTLLPREHSLHRGEEQSFIWSQHSREQHSGL